MPAATFRPLLPSTLSGCSAMDLSRPPISTLAPRPTPTVAWPSRRHSRPAARPAHVGGGREHAPDQHAAFGVADVDAELGDRAGVMLGGWPLRRKVQCRSLEEPKTKPQPLATLQVSVADLHAMRAPHRRRRQWQGRPRQPPRPSSNEISSHIESPLGTIAVGPA